MTIAQCTITIYNIIYLNPSPFLSFSLIHCPSLSLPLSLSPSLSLPLPLFPSPYLVSPFLYLPLSSSISLLSLSPSTYLNICRCSSLHIFHPRLTSISLNLLLPPHTDISLDIPPSPTFLLFLLFLSHSLSFSLFIPPTTST